MWMMMMMMLMLMLMLMLINLSVRDNVHVKYISMPNTVVKPNADFVVVVERPIAGN